MSCFANPLDMRHSLRCTRTRFEAIIHVRRKVLRTGQGLRRYDAEKSGVVGFVVGFYPYAATVYQTATTLRRKKRLLTYACTHARAHTRKCVSYRRNVVVSYYLYDKKEKSLRQSLRRLKNERCSLPISLSGSALAPLNSLISNKKGGFYGQA